MLASCNHFPLLKLWIFVGGHNHAHGHGKDINLKAAIIHVLGDTIQVTVLVQNVRMLHVKCT